MSLPKIEERTLYPPITKYLENIGFSAIGEVKVGDGHADCLFKFDSINTIIEVKIGKVEKGLGAIAQALRYAKELKTQNIIILIYPEKYRNQQILNFNAVEDIAINQKEIYALVQTDFLVEAFEHKSGKEIFDTIKNYFILKKPKIDFRTVVRQIEGYVRDLNFAATQNN